MGSDSDLLYYAKKLKEIRDARRVVKDILAVKSSLLGRGVKVSNINGVTKIIQDKTSRKDGVIGNTYIAQQREKLNKNQLDIVNKFI